MKIYGNMLCRDEPFSPLAICAVAPFVSKFLVHDTGSEKSILDDIYKTKEFCPNVEIIERPLENAHGWISSNVEGTMNHNVSQALGDIRREQQRISEEEGADFIFVVDGDEIVPPELIKNLLELLSNPSFNKESIHLPFVDVVHSFEWVRHDHFMGRLFKCGVTELRGGYPVEMNYSKTTNRCLEPGLPECHTITYSNDTEAVLHTEAICKPWRKNLNIKRKYNGSLPDVLFDPKYKRFQRHIQRWLP